MDLTAWGTCILTAHHEGECQTSQQASALKSTWNSYWTRSQAHTHAGYRPARCAGSPLIRSDSTTITRRSLPHLVHSPPPHPRPVACALRGAWLLVIHVEHVVNPKPCCQSNMWLHVVRCKSKARTAMPLGTFAGVACLSEGGCQAAEHHHGADGLIRLLRTGTARKCTTGGPRRASQQPLTT